MLNFVFQKLEYLHFVINNVKSSFDVFFKFYLGIPIGRQFQ